MNKVLTLFLIMCVQPAPMLYAEDKLAGEPERSQSDTVSSAEQQLNFKVRLDGVEDAALGSILDRTVEQSIESRRRPESIGALQRQFRSHVTALQSRLRAEGYYAADVQYKIKDDADPVGVEIDVETGPLYTLKSISLLYFGPDS
ncbi:MAG: POTRA domain-containing protein, partial [Arenicellales bacterium]